MKMQINHIEAASRVDGPGERVVLFVQGCPIHCRGCQSKKTWNPKAGRAEDVTDIAQTLAALAARHGNVTLSGGEVFAQPQALAQLVTELKALGVKNIVVYSGYTWDQLLSHIHPAYPYLREILTRIDVLVDGPYIKDLDDDLITWRGSRNQRPIDVPTSLVNGLPVVLDWDAPRVIIRPDGSLLLPVGLDLEGEAMPTRMCGQIAEVI